MVTMVQPNATTLVSTESRYLTTDDVRRAAKLSNSTETRETIDRVLSNTATGPVSSAIGNSFFGINHRKQPGAIAINKDESGLTFFTRPRLNLTPENLRNVRQLTPLLNRETASLQRIVRSLLDPESNWATAAACPFVDPQQAFMPILSNNLLSMSGWPDLEAKFTDSQEGVYKEAYSLVDSHPLFHSTYDITANFRNLPGDPITLIFLTWILYMGFVAEGSLSPYPDSILLNEVDYDTRIYRLVMDPTKTYVQKIGACGACFPRGVPIGAAFNFDSTQPYGDTTNQISIPFHAMGAMYMDDILAWEFNRVVEIFNDNMTDEKRAKNYKKIPYAALNLFNHRGYPRINLNTYELEWWIDETTYNAVMPLLKDVKTLSASTSTDKSTPTISYWS